MGSVHAKRKVLKSKDIDEMLPRPQLGEEGAHMVHFLFRSKAITSNFREAAALNMVDDASRAELTSQMIRIALGKDNSAGIGPENDGCDKKVKKNW